MKKKKLNKEKITKVLVYVLCFALVGISLFSLFSLFVGATDGENERVSDLTNTTWCFTDGYSAVEGYGIFEVELSYFHEALGMPISSEFLYIGYDIDQTPKAKHVYTLHSSLGEFSLPGFVTFTITGGEDVTNASLISWLYQNGELQEEETTSPECTHHYEYVRSLPELQGTHSDVYTCAYCNDTYYEYAIPCEYAVSSVDGVISGYCLSCSQECDHQWKDGYCSVCTFPCPHENHTIDGSCSDCDMTSGAHNFNNVVREPNGSDQYHTTKKYCDCGYVETDFEVEHTYVDSKCSACEYQCTHSLFSDTGVCVYCGFACVHPSTESHCVYTTNPENHPWETFCTVCGVVTKTTYVEHIFNSEHKCSCCEYICTHSEWIDGACAYCGLACGHDKGFDTSFSCYTCGYVCPHSSKSYIVRYSSNVISHHLDRVCDLCEYTLLTTDQAHVFNSEYKCSACGYNCTHSEFDGIVCDYCGYNCPHDTYTEGACDLCGFACPHRWEKSTCKICALACENHTFSNGSLRCDTCDYYVIYDGYQQNDGFFKLMTAIFDAQTNTYFSLLGYEILGVNIAYFVLSLVTLALAIIVFKIVKKVM